MNRQHEKLQALLSENAITAEELAFCLGIEPDKAEAVCSGKKALTKKLARQIEQTFHKPAFWLDADHDNDGPNYDLFG